MISSLPGVVGVGRSEECAIERGSLEQEIESALGVGQAARTVVTGIVSSHVDPGNWIPYLINDDSMGPSFAWNSARLIHRGRSLGLGRELDRRWVAHSRR